MSSSGVPNPCLAHTGEDFCCLLQEFPSCVSTLILDMHKGRHLQRKEGKGNKNCRLMYLFHSKHPGTRR